MSALPFQDGDSILIITKDGQYLKASRKGIKLKNKPKHSCFFKLVKKGKAKWSILSHKKKYLSVGEGGEVSFSSKIPISSETFLFSGLSPQEVQILYKNPNTNDGDYYYVEFKESLEFGLTKDSKSETTIFNFEIM